MAKARPLRKPGRKAGSKSAKNRRQGGVGAQAKRPVAKRAAKPARPAHGSRTSALPAQRKLGAGGATRVAERPAVTPEIPPPLPAPIASFTF
jgi:hypothetical protein